MTLIKSQEEILKFLDTTIAQTRTDIDGKTNHFEIYVQKVRLDTLLLIKDELFGPVKSKAVDLYV